MLTSRVASRTYLLFVLLLGSASVSACAAIWGFQDSPGDAGGPVDGMARESDVPDATPDARSDAHDARNEVVVPTDSNASDAAVTDPCKATVPETYAFYVSAKNGKDSTTCGGFFTPCASIGFGITNAFLAPAPRHIINVEEGSYTESLALMPGLTVVGGWIESSSGWTKDMSSSPAPRTQLVVQPTMGTKTVTAGSPGAAATLCALTLKGKAPAAPGETLYGVFATGTGTTVVLDDVEVQVSAGGDGASGKDGGTGAPGSKNGCPTVGTGVTGTPTGTTGPAGAAGAFDSTGYVPGMGGTGGAGMHPGDDGTVGGAGMCVTCVSCTTVAVLCKKKTTSTPCGLDGIPGCGGNGGEPGTGGGGGGSSVGVFAWGATVTLTDSLIRAANGGNGAMGGAGGAGGPGEPGVAGMSGGKCPTACGAGCAPASFQSATGGSGGGPGGSGSSGGAGGGGSGGFSCAIVQGGGVTVALDASMLMSGTGGTGVGTAPGGNGGDAGVCSF